MKVTLEQVKVAQKQLPKFLAAISEGLGEEMTEIYGFEGRGVLGPALVAIGVTYKQYRKGPEEEYECNQQANQWAEEVSSLTKTNYLNKPKEALDRAAEILSKNS